MIRVGPRARAHAQGGEERRDKVGETHKEERRKEVVLKERSGCGTHFFLNLKRESGKLVKAALFSTIWTRFP